jgi:2-succinyl-6-hydroxy-2,4-cyclohexadiene-1-carboxylate synthase
MTTDPYLIPGTDTLRNIPGFVDAAGLAAFEFEATYARATQLRHRPIPGRYDLDHLCSFHRHLFGDVYDWAGELRTVNIVKGTTPFAFANALVPAASELFSELARENFLSGLDLTRFVARAAFYLSELNALHPFREGNGRTQRAFLSQLAISAGWHIDWELITAEQNINASIATFVGDETAFVDLLGTITSILPSATNDQRRPLRAVPDPKRGASDKLGVVFFGPVRGPRVVALHGFTQTANSWTTIGASLSTWNELAAVDLPGHGASGDVRADLAGTAELVAHQAGRATYLGYSMGGRVALHLALAFPHLVERLVLIGATGGIDDAAERAERRKADEALAATIERDGVPAFLDRWLAQPLFARLKPDAADRADRERNTAAGLASSLRLTGTGTQTPLWSRLHELTMPVLVIAGEHDPKFTELGERLVSNIGANATLAIIEGAGHTVHLEQPDAFVARYRVWDSANPIAYTTPNTS